ncbi:hypothetical protein JTB14_005757 [Gonioctena quinquepunctata]|nr:hypothetical protein JTB14_005757 [Gonioctena quinquepunctata]
MSASLGISIPPQVSTPVKLGEWGEISRILRGGDWFNVYSKVFGSVGQNNIFPLSTSGVNGLLIQFLSKRILSKTENAPPLHWPMRRVVYVFPGADGKVRVVTIKTQNRVLNRPVSKLCPLPLDET